MSKPVKAKESIVQPAVAATKKVTVKAQSKKVAKAPPSSAKDISATAKVGVTAAKPLTKAEQRDRAIGIIPQVMLEHKVSVEDVVLAYESFVFDKPQGSVLRIMKSRISAFIAPVVTKDANGKKVSGDPIASAQVELSPFLARLGLTGQSLRRAGLDGRTIVECSTPAGSGKVAQKKVPSTTKSSPSKTVKKK